jgi:hypothetical protein
LIVDLLLHMFKISLTSYEMRGKSGVNMWVSKSFVAPPAAGVVSHKPMLQRLSLSLSIELDSENQEAGLIGCELPRLCNDDQVKLQKTIAGALARAGLDLPISYHKCVRGHLLRGEVCRFEYLYVGNDNVSVDGFIASANQHLPDILSEGALSLWSQELVLLKSLPVKNSRSRTLISVASHNPGPSFFSGPSNQTLGVLRQLR